MGIPRTALGHNMDTPRELREHPADAPETAEALDTIDVALF